MCYWILAVLLKFQGLLTSVPCVLAPSLKQGEFSGDSHLCVPLFEILVVNKSVIMEILETSLLRYTRTGQPCFLGVENCLFSC